MTTTQVLAAVTLGTLLILAGDQSVRAQSYPERPVTIVVPFAVGGNNDVLARLLARSLSSQLKQEVLVVNRPGASGILGTAAAADAPSDGYTLLLGTSSTLAIAPTLFTKISYDPTKSFAPIAPLSQSPGVLVVNTHVAAASCPDLVKQARDNPGKYQYASAGRGTQSHLDGHLFGMRANINIVHIPFRGASASVSNVVNGTVEMTFESLGLVLPRLRASELRALAITSQTRNANIPNVPTMDECGYPGFLSNWAALLAPAKTPEAIVRQLNEAVNTVLQYAEIQKGLSDLGMEPVAGTSGDLVKRIAADMQEWRLILQSSQIKME